MSGTYDYDPYASLATEFICRVRQSSSAAADCLQQIRIQHGTRMAYLAAFALIMLKGRLNREGYSSLHAALRSFTCYEEMQNSTDAIRLYEEAAKHLLSQEKG